MGENEKENLEQRILVKYRNHLAGLLVAGGIAIGTAGLVDNNETKGALYLAFGVGLFGSGALLYRSREDSKNTIVSGQAQREVEDNICYFDCNGCPNAYSCTKKRPA